MPKIPALPIIRSAISEGLSANQAYKRMVGLAREQTQLTGERWTGIRRETFNQIYGQTLSIRSNVADALDAPKDIIPGEGLVKQRTSVRARGYGNWAVVFSRQIGSTTVEAEFYFQRTEDPLTPQQVENSAESDFISSTQQQHGTKRGYVFLGASYTGTEFMTPENG